MKYQQRRHTDSDRKEQVLYPPSKQAGAVLDGREAGCTARSPARWASINPTKYLAPPVRALLGDKAAAAMTDYSALWVQDA